ncbi:MAG: TlpA family protein disulfide reductase [Mucilaginibacter sp.]
MKKLIMLNLLLLAVLVGDAQIKNINPEIPHYRILKADSTYVTWATLKKRVPLVIIYFMPDCPHCQHLMGQIKQNIQTFKDIQIVLITDTRTEYPYLNMLRDFSKRFDLPRYKNITMGTEYPTYLVNDYYQLQTTPFVAIYDRTGKMVKCFDKPTELKEIVAVVKRV